MLASASTTPIAFQIPVQPGQAPYAFYAHANLTFRGQVPTNYTAAAAGTVPFAGTWAVFSWAPETWTWTEQPADGANMTHFARSFTERLAEGA